MYPNYILWPSNSRIYVVSHQSKKLVGYMAPFGVPNAGLEADHGRQTAQEGSDLGFRVHVQGPGMMGFRV